MSPQEKTSLFAGPIWTSAAQAYREEVRDDLTQQVAPLVDQAEQDRQFPRAAIVRLGERGHFSRRWAHPGPHGDVGMATIFANELGKLLAGGIGAGLSLQADAAPAILRTSFSDSPFVQRLHDDALGGRKVLCIAVSEPSSGSDPGRFLTRAHEDPDGSWTVEGRKKFISLSATADYALVLARTGESPQQFTFFAVPQGEGGYRIVRHLGKQGTHSVETCELELPSVRVPAEQVVGRLHAGLGPFARAMTAERLAVCAQLTGALEAGLELARAYLRQRPARPGTLWDFQALRHRFADLYAEHKVLSDAVVATASALQHGLAGQQDIAALKLVVTSRVNHCLPEVMQLFGGVGYLDDLPLERAVRDAQMARFGSGTEDIMREIVATIPLPEERLYEIVDFDDLTGEAVPRSRPPS